MPAINHVSRRDLITLALILFVAAVIRLDSPGIVEFKLDEAHLALMAQDMLRGGPIPWIGIPSSVGMPNSPMSVYFMAIPYLVGNHPIAATMFIAAFNVVGVGLLWLIAHRYFDRTVALAAGLAYALNPWAVLFSRKIWEQNFHTPIFLAALLLGLYGFYEGRRWAQALFLPVLTIALQIHPAAWALLPLAGIMLWMGRRRISWPAAAASVALAAITLTPYAIGIQQTFANDPGRLDYMRGRSAALGLRLDVTALRWTTDLATGLGIETQLTPTQMADLLARVPPQTQLWALLGGLTLLGLVFVWWPRTRTLAPLVGAWALLPLVAFTPTWTRVYPHYFIAGIPALSLLAGVTVGWLARHLPGKPLSRVVVLTAFVAILLTQGLWWRGLMRYVDTVPTTGRGFGTPLYRLTAIRAALESANDVIVVANNANIQSQLEPAIWTSLLLQPGRCVRAVDGGNLLVIPARAFDALIAPDAADSTVRNYYAAGNAVGSFGIPPDDGQYTITHFDRAAPLPGPPFTRLTPARFANDVTLIGYRMAGNGVLAGWKLPEPRLENYQTFVHILDVEGNRIAQKDQGFYPGRFWCAGDTLITGTLVELPDDAAVIRIGLYTLRNRAVTNIPVVDAAGNPAASWVDVPLPSPPAPLPQGEG